MNKNNTHGGYRKGSGRKKKEPTVVRRIPLTIVDIIDKLINRHKSKKTFMTTPDKEHSDRSIHSVSERYFKLTEAVN